MSRIGRRVVELLRALDTAAVLVADPYADSAAVAAAGRTAGGARRGAAAPEIVACTLPALPETRQVVGARELALLPDGATVINTARGWSSTPRRWSASARAGRLNAILDVTDPEPLPASSVLPTCRTS